MGANPSPSGTAPRLRGRSLSQASLINYFTFTAITVLASQITRLSVAIVVCQSLALGGALPRFLDQILASDNSLTLQVVIAHVL
jgi:hypothetical protein